MGALFILGCDGHRHADLFATSTAGKLTSDPSGIQEQFRKLRQTADSKHRAKRFLSLLWIDVGMTGDFLPTSVLLHPYSREPQMFGLSRVGHLPAPHHGLAPSSNHGIAIHPDILDLSVVGRDHQEARLNHRQNLL